MQKKVMTLVLLGCMLLVGSQPAMSANPWKQMKKVLKEIKDPVFPDRDFLITDYYNGKDTLYTAAIQRAIDDCSARGGGRVVIPDGQFKTGPLRLRSNVNLHLSDNAKLLFTTDVRLYPLVLTRYEGIDCYNYQPLIYAYEVSNIAVTGKGILDGQASRANWYSPTLSLGRLNADGSRTPGKDVLFQWNKDQTPVNNRRLGGDLGIRTQFINVYKCKNVLLEDITLNRSPFWLIHPLMSENVTLRRVKMLSHGPNNDGCDPESCRNVLIDDCDFDTGDDCIAIKSGRDQDGRRWNVPTENVIVRNCRMKDGHAGVAIGSEISGSCHHVWVEGCEMNSPNLQRIIRIKSNSERGGEVSDVNVRNVKVGECDLAILGIELCYWHVKEGPYPPHFHHISFENITSNKSRFAVHVDGFDNKIMAHDIVFKNCDFRNVQRPEINVLRGVDRITFKKVKVNGMEMKHIRGDLGESLGKLF